MNKKFQTVLSIIFVVAISLACANSTPEANSQDAINTAVAGTQQSSALSQATVNASVLTAMPAPATPTPGPTVEYVTLTEEELAALIDEAVAEAIAATETTTSTVYSTTSDDVVTTEEVAYVYEYYYYADYYVEYAEDLLAEYYELYADLATDMIAELNAIEAELAQINDTLSSIDSSLQQISSTLEQGAQATQEAIAQLESAAQQAQTNAQELQTQAQDMIAVLQAEQQTRANAVTNIQPNNIPTDKISALQSAFSFIDAAKSAMGDNKLSRDELMNLAQLGANAQAGFQNFGGADALGPDLSQFDNKFSEITTQMARGQIPQAKDNLGRFEISLGNRPGGGGGPGLPNPRP
jgi:exonuclease VII small subunit